MKQITLTIKNVYGNELAYPVCDDAKLFALLINKKTFTDSDIVLIQQLGYTIKYVSSNVTLSVTK